MKYTIVPPAAYWLILLFAENKGHPWLGLVAGGVAVFGLWSLFWKLDFGSWRFWK